IGCPMSASAATVLTRGRFRSSTAGLTPYKAPPNPALPVYSRIRRPHFAGSLDAPTTAMTCGSNKGARLPPSCLATPAGPATVKAVVRNRSIVVGGGHGCWGPPGQRSKPPVIDRSIDSASVRGTMTQNSTSERIHRAALRLFATYGFAGTGIRKIADEAG